MSEYLKDDAWQLALDAVDLRIAFEAKTPTAWRKVGMDWDVTMNVMFLLGKVGQTVSLHTAIAGLRQHKAWGCIGCRLLSVFVQKNHCADQFTNEPALPSVYERAGLCFLGGVAALGGLAVGVGCFALAAAMGII